jgi:hypothetical protein
MAGGRPNPPYQLSCAGCIGGFARLSALEEKIIFIAEKNIYIFST